LNIKTVDKLDIANIIIFVSFRIILKQGLLLIRRIMMKKLSRIFAIASILMGVMLIPNSAQAWWGGWSPWNWFSGPGWGNYYYPYYGGYNPYYGGYYPYYGGHYPHWGAYPHYGAYHYPYYPYYGYHQAPKSNDNK
jgi:hypothetical protein